MKRRNLLITIIIAVCILVVILLFYIREPLLEIIKPILIAFILVYLFNPLVNYLELKKVSRNLAITFIYFLFVICCILVLRFMVPQFITGLNNFSRTIPEHFDKYEILFHEFVIRYKYSELPIGIKNIITQNIDGIQYFLISLMHTSINIITGMFSFAIEFVLGAIIAFYLLKDVAKVKEFLISTIPIKWRGKVIVLFKEIDVVLSGFVRGHLLVSLIVSVISILGLYILGIKYAIIFGVIAGLSNLVPYFGPIIGTIPPVLYALLESPIGALKVIVLFFIIQQFESAVLSPKIIGKRVGLHPATSIVSVIAGGRLFGLPGLILSVPVVGIIRVIVRNFKHKGSV